MKNVEKFIIIIRNNPSPPPPSSCAALIKFAQLLDLSVSILDTS
jgi:nanoRNase/pAp phosphatase (c-di-AMP/oligoRNAs hydrolase)